MKKTILLGIVLCLNVITYAQQSISFNDTNFKNALLNHSPSIDTNGDDIIDTEEAEQITTLRIYNSGITNLIGIEYFTNIKILNVSGNSLTDIDISKNIKLRHLNINENNLTSIDVTNNTNLITLSFDGNSLTDIDISKNIKLASFACYKNQLKTLDVSNNINLEVLFCGYNQITEIDVRNNVNLKDLSVRGNALTTLDISDNTNLEALYCTSNKLVNLDVRNNTNLKKLYCDENKLSILNVDNNINLQWLVCARNQLTNLNVSNNINLKNLGVNDNQLTNIDLNNNRNLKVLGCTNNQLTSLDTRSCMLTNIYFSHNPNLTFAFLTGQKFQTTPKLGISFNDCPELKFICVDEEYIVPVQNLFNGSQYTSCDVNSTCSHDYYTISGKVTYDLDANGCDNNDIGFTDLTFYLSGGSIGFRDVSPRNSGIYSTVVNQGNYFMFPNFENPTYFNIDPAPSFPPTPISFPSDGPNLIKNFCITPNGIHNDLEVLIIPTGTRPRPGFDTGYTIVYKNKGTSIQSGSVTLDYMQDILSLVSANPNTTSTVTNQLSWDFSNLKPLESREITIVLNINKPTDNPAVNDGDVLSYTATVIGATDETPDNNTVPLNQTIINSYDPNDKICLEGDTVEPKNLGKYLHYMIRFENKGTADAVNVTVKDNIDTTKLDIKSFIPLKASHPYTTTVNNKKEVEFVFNQINLPFDDANNDGYILFKIKPKPSLIEGDIINNKAAIYFDFNPPVITDVETVTIKKKVIEKPVFDDYFTLLPNPTKGIMSLTSTNTNIAVQYISIHDVVGRIIGFFSADTRDFNVSYLYPNTYFMQVHSDKGILSTTFIKIN